MGSIIYGPVPSWRLGRSLGIDVIATRSKVCSFDCLYCQLGNTIHPVTRRKEFVSLTDLAQELQAVKDVPIDYATFSGMGEPTLAENLGRAIELVKSTLHMPVAVLTNSSLMPREDVRRELALADVVVAKVDAPTEQLYHRINRPRARYNLAQVLQAIKTFRSEYRGKLALQMMFLDDNKDAAAAMAKLAEELSPDEVQINTPLRPCAVKPLPPEEIADIRRAFSALNGVVTVYEASRPQVSPLNPGETLRCRPAPEDG